MTDVILEAGALALLDAADLSAFWDDERETRLVAGAVIAAVTPLIEAAALERAAFFDSDKYVRPVLESATSLIRDAALEEAASMVEQSTLVDYSVLKYFAADIRALKEQP